jgi:hypothetical protein
MKDCGNIKKGMLDLPPESVEKLKGKAEFLYS